MANRSDATAHSTGDMSGSTARPFHNQASRTIPASGDDVFAYLDDHQRLSGHMSRPSWMMAGSYMTIGLDDGKGRAVGSRIRLGGRILGIPLGVEQIVTEYVPPLHKAWQTVGTPRLLVIGPYRMGFEVSEPPRVCRRLQLLREWSHDERIKAEEVLSRGA